MTMQISAISLYGKNGERRDIEFNIGEVNIITGASKKGKSSLLDIVEYCLGSSECTVAEGHIKKTVDWYAVLLQFPDTQVFIARAAPLPGVKSNSSSHFLVEKEITIPNKDELEANTNIDSVMAFLTSKLGVPEQITEVPPDQTRSEISISFKHSKYYLFQGQDEIAAKKFLFHRQAEPHIPQAIKDTMPYFLGAAEDDRLSDLQKLRSLKQDRTRLYKKLNEIESLKGDGLEKGYTLLAEAAEVGLYRDSNLVPSEEELLSIFKEFSRWTPHNGNVEDEIEDPLSKLEQEYRGLNEKKQNIRVKLREAKEYLGVEDHFEDAVKAQELRLQTIGLFKKYDTADGVCPVCNSVHEGPTRIERIITSSLQSLDNKLEGVERSKPRLTTYISTLEDEQKKFAIKIKTTRNSIESIRSENIELSREADEDLRKAHVAGRISLYIDSINWQEDTRPIKQKIKLLEPQIIELEQKLDPEALKERLDTQLSCIAEDMTKWARELKLEHSEYRIRVDQNKLTVVAETPHGLIPLNNMGSGENWVGYHLVAYLAFAKWFIEQNRPVGRFIFLDQPTQVYFPADIANTGSLDEIQKDEDRQAVKSMFKWIFKVVKELSPNLQVIITDHADIDEEWFQDAVRDVKWRGDDALIPDHWYAELEQ